MLRQSPPPNPPPGPPPPTVDLVNQAKTGDFRAWLDLDERYRRRLALLIRGRIPSALRPRFDTDDVVQSAMFQAYKDLDSFQDDGSGSFQRWISRILINRFYSRVRFHRARLRDTQAESHVEDVDTLPESQASLWVDRTDAEAADAIATLLDKLSDQSEEVNLLIRRRFFDGLTFKQLAKEYKTSEATVRRRVSAALLKLRHA